MKELNGAVDNNNVQMYAPTNQRPDFHYNVNNDSRQKLLFGQDYVETSIYLGPFLFDENIYGQSYLKLLNDEIKWCNDL